MIKDHRRSPIRMFGGAAAVTALAGAALALGSPSFASQGEQAEPPKQDEAEPRRERSEERIIIRTHRIGEGEHRRHREHSSAEGRRERGEHAGHDRRVIVMTHRDGEARHGEQESDGEHRTRRFDMYLPHGGHGGHGGQGVLLATAVCDGERSEVNEGDEHTRVIVCSRGTASAAERIERMQRVRDRLAEDGELSAEQRGRVAAALDREIARLRGQ